MKVSTALAFLSLAATSGRETFGRIVDGRLICMLYVRAVAELQGVSNLLRSVRPRAIKRCNGLILTHQAAWHSFRVTLKRTPGRANRKGKFRSDQSFRHLRNSLISLTETG